MTKPAKPKDLKSAIEKELTTMLAATTEPSEGRMKLLKTCIGFLAVQAKLEESEYGGFFGDNDAATGIPAKPRPEPSARSHEGEPDGDGAFFAEGATGDLPAAGSLTQ